MMPDINVPLPCWIEASSRPLLPDSAGWPIVVYKALPRPGSYEPSTGIILKRSQTQEQYMADFREIYRASFSPPVTAVQATEYTEEPVLRSRWWRSGGRAWRRPLLSVLNPTATSGGCVFCAPSGAFMDLNQELLLEPRPTLYWPFYEA